MVGYAPQLFVTRALYFMAPAPCFKACGMFDPGILLITTAVAAKTITKIPMPAI